MHLALPSHAMYFSAIIFEFDFTKMPETFTGGQLQSFTILKKIKKYAAYNTRLMSVLMLMILKYLVKTFKYS